MTRKEYTMAALKALDENQVTECGFDLMIASTRYYCEDGGYERIKRSYSHLTDAELRQELQDRTARRYDTRKVGADGCMTDALVIRACREILDSHDTLSSRRG